jgi:hypothetical protein
MFRFKLTPDGQESVEIQGSSRDVLQWERRGKTNTMARLREEMRMTDLYKIAFLAATRLGVWSGTEADFMETVELDILDDEADDSEDPTKSAA